MQQQPSGFLQVTGEMVSIVLLALAGRFIGFAQATLESGTPLSVDRALSYIADTVGLFAHPNHLALLLAVLSVAALIRIAIAYANRSVLLILKEHAGIDANELSWAQRAVRLPVAVLYRALSGIATLIGGLALAISFRLFNPEMPFGTSELWSYVQALAGGLSYATLGAILVLFALYGVAVAIIGYVASPAILTIDEMASGCRRTRILLLGPSAQKQCRPRTMPARDFARSQPLRRAGVLRGGGGMVVNAGCEQSRCERRLGSR